MSEILESNVLIIGKTGVGKSSLLNYIFDKKLMETGTGRPVTKKGVFTKKLHVNDNFRINLSDTWGLEANKAKEWEALIHNEIKKHDCQEIAGWYHTILFCISARSARVEEFEKRIIRSLIEDGNSLIVVLTHADMDNIEGVIREMKVELKAIGVSEANIIKVSSVSKKLLSGRTTKAFGREEVLAAIKDNLWKTLASKLPHTIDRIIDESLDTWYNRSRDYINKELKWYNSSSNKKLEEVSLEVKELFDLSMDGLKFKLSNKYQEAYDYYSKLSQRYEIILKEELQYNDLDYKFDFRINLTKIISENLKLSTIFLGPISIFIRSFKIRDKRKKTILAKLEVFKDELAMEIKKRNKAEINKIIVGE